MDWEFDLGFERQGLSLKVAWHGLHVDTSFARRRTAVFTIYKVNNTSSSIVRTIDKGKQHSAERLLISSSLL